MIVQTHSRPKTIKTEAETDILTLQWDGGYFLLTDTDYEDNIGAWETVRFWLEQQRERIEREGREVIS